MSKNWAIVGAGNGGQAFAAYLSLQGYNIRIYDVFQETVDELNRLGGVELVGKAKKTGFGKIEMASTDMKEVVSGAEVILVVLPSLYHKSMAEKMAPYLTDGQLVILNPNATLGPIEFKKVLNDKGCKADVTIAGASTLLFACRADKVGHVIVNGQKSTLTIAAYPSCKNSYVAEKTKDIFPEYAFADDIITVAFDNLNALFHPAPSMLYLPFIEKGMDYQYYIDFVPSMTKVIKKLDKERMAIAEAYGKKIDNVTEAFRKMYNLEGDDLHQMITASGVYDGIKGQKTLKTRYILEDIPCSLVPLQTLGKIAGVDTLAIDTIINLSHVLLDDEVEEGRTKAGLGLPDNITVEGFLKLCSQG